jgi:hypothetical protein
MNLKASMYAKFSKAVSKIGLTILLILVCQILGLINLGDDTVLVCLTLLITLGLGRIEMTQREQFWRI